MNKDWLDINVLEDYLDGKLDPKTMNRVEREALDDPFVAEALAGLSASPKRSLQSLSLLQKQLHERVAEHQQVKKTSVITWQRLSIAATAAVMFVAISIMFWMRENNQQNELAGRAKKVDVTIAPAKPGTEPPAVASAPVAADILSADHDASEKEIDKAIKAAKTNTYARIKPKAKTAIPQAAPQQLNEVAVVGYASRQKRNITGAVISLETKDGMNLLSGKVVAHDDGKPLPGVYVMVNGTNLAAVTDTNGEFKIKTDTTVKEGNLYVNYLGFKSTELLAKANQPVNVSLIPDNQALNEVVVATVSKAKKEHYDSAKLGIPTAGKVADVRIRGVSSLPGKMKMVANPVGGWSQLWNYIEQNNAFKAEKKIGQFVELSFKIDKDGTPIDLKIEKGAGNKYEQEAIRLILNGPKWELPEKRNSRMTFVMDF